MKVICPKCNSDQITSNQKGFSGGKAVAGAILTGGIGLLAGMHGSKKVVITCLACGSTFKPGEGKQIREEGDPPVVITPPSAAVTPAQEKAQSNGLIWILGVIVVIAVVIGFARSKDTDAAAGAITSQLTADDVKNNSYLKVDEYEIIVNDTRYPDVKNLHVFMKKKPFDSSYVYSFIDKFRAEYCTGKCNVNVYDSKGIKDLVLKYPIKGKQYILLADHFVSSSEFSNPTVRDWYPYQDIFYKEQGGKNWKKPKKQ